MPPALFALILGLELLVALTILAPTALPGRFAQRPQVGIWVWLAGFALAVAAALVSITAAFWLAVSSYLELATQPLAETEILPVLAASFAPWLLLAGAGVTLVLANLRLQYRGPAARELLDQVNATGDVTNWLGRSILVVPTPLPIAGVLGGQILISAGVDALPPEQRAAVLWHELAHIRLGHTRLKNVARLVARVLPQVSAARAMRAELDRLSELAADTWAARRCDPAALIAVRGRFQEWSPTSER